MLLSIVLTSILPVLVNSFAWDEFNIKRLFENSEKILNEIIKYEPSEAKCIEDFKEFVDQVTSGKKEWGKQVMDTWGKEPVGFFSKVDTSFGHFDQCIEVAEPFGHQYCSVLVENTSNFSYSLGICVPKSCEKSTVRTVLIPFFENAEITVQKVDQCENGDNPPFGFFQWFTIIICAILIGFSVVGTVNEALGKNGILNSFSLRKNADKLFDQRSTNFGSMNCLNGFRVLSMMWIVLLHSYHEYLYTSGLSNPNDLQKFQFTFAKTFIQHGDLAVDTFFMIGGLLLAYNFMKTKESRQEPFNVFKYYLHRYLRLIPVFAIVMVIMVSFAPYFGSGSRKYEWTDTFMVNNCKEYWWSGLLLVQNYVNAMEMCIIPSWYISADMQLYILSPLILFPLIKYGKKLFPYLILISLASIGFMFVYSLSNKFHFNYKPDEYKKYIYYPTHARISQWLIGVALGYILYKTKDKEFKLRKRLNLVLWIVSLTTLVMIIYIPYPNYRDETENVLSFAFYASLHRPVWALAVSWMTFACAKGYGGPVNWFLSFPFYQPFAKLSFAVYMIHFPLKLQVASLQRNLVWFNGYLMFHFFLSILTFSLLLAIPVVLMVEMPIGNAEIEIYKVIESRTMKSKPSNSIQM